METTGLNVLLQKTLKCSIGVKIKESYLKATVISTERARAVKAIMVSSFWLAWKSWARLWAKSWMPPEMELAPVPELIELEGTHLFRSGELKKHFNIIWHILFSIFNVYRQFII